MDCFFLEGPKVLYRISLALVHLFVKSMFTNDDVFVFKALKKRNK
jgi:hypothetical protein